MKRIGLFSLAFALVALLTGCWMIGPTGTVEGIVVDATNGQVLEDVSVSAQGITFASATTDANGEFSLVLPIGPQVLEFSLNGFDFSPVDVDVDEGETTTLATGQVVGSPELTGDGIRFVLSWGELPYDLDSHLITPSGYHIYFGNKTPTGAGAMLDWDDTSSYGPETVTITDQESGTYGYYVYNWSGSPAITTSGAVVRVYDSDGLVEIVSVPTTGTGLYWNVASLNGSTLTIINDITSTEPTY